MRRHSPNSMIQGFTLIELLVTVAIFVFMTALIVSRYGAFNQGTLMTNLAYDVALSIRTAQTYGVSVKGVDNLSGGSGYNQTFSGSYGVHYDRSTSAAARTFLIYVDSSSGANNDSMYEAGETIVAQYNIKQGAVISDLCASADAGQTCTSVNILDITFKRPDPSAIICTGGSCVSGANPYNFARVTLNSADGLSKRIVTIRGNGQISVGN